MFELKFLCNPRPACQNFEIAKSFLKQPETPNNKIMKTIPLGLTIAAALTALTAHTALAEWTKIEDFQEIQPEDIDRWVLVEDPQAVLYVDNFDPMDENNRSLYMDAGFHGIRHNAWNATIDLPQEISIGTKVTLKFDFMAFGPGVSLHVGLTPIPFETNEFGWIIGPSVPAWNDFEVMLSMLTPISMRDGQNLRASQFTAPIEEWITFYLVIDSTSKTTVAYARTQDGVMRKLTYTLESGEQDSFLWRVGRDEPLLKVFLASANGASIGYGLDDIYLLDNLYIDYSGENLDDGSSASEWAGFPLNESGWADTGSFLGMVSPLGDWVYVDQLEAYIHLPESQVGASGAWIYKVAASPVAGDTAETWAGYSSVDGSWYDTGALFGWLAPAGDWVYLHTLEKYLYVPESLVSPEGAWAFVLR